MGSCDYEAVSALVDGELTEKECDAVLEHLNRCQDCCRLFERFHAARTLFRGESGFGVPEDFSERVTAALHSRSEADLPPAEAAAGPGSGGGPGRLSGRGGGWLAAAAGVAAVAVATGVLWERGGPAAPDTAPDAPLARTPAETSAPPAASGPDTSRSDTELAEFDRYLREHSGFVPAGEGAEFRRAGLEVDKR